MDSSWEEVSKRLMVFTENLSLQMRDPSSLIKTKSYWLAKINKLQQSGRGGGGARMKLEKLQELVA